MLAVATGCGASSGGPVTATASTSPAPTAIPAVTTAAAPRTKWVDLAVGDCLADPPPADPSVVDVAVAACAGAHSAEVFARTPVAVNAAVAPTADRECAAAFARYTGRPVDDGGLAITYLIDSDQDRTAHNPRPSTVICLLQSADGRPLTGSAHS